MKDEAARLRAEQDFDTNLLIEAGAGTGKTTLLVERAYRALMEQDIAPRELVLITFMEKASLEIRDRLEARLQSSPPEMAERAEAVREHLGEAVIATIHGLASRLLREYAVAARVSPYFEVLDDREEKEAWRTVWRQWLSDPSPEEEDVLRGLLRWGITVPQLEASARESLALDPDSPPVRPSPDIAGFFRELDHMLDECCPVAEVQAPETEPGRLQVEKLRGWRLGLAGVRPEEWAFGLAMMPSLSPKGAQKRWSDAEALKRQKAWLQALKEAHETLLQEVADHWLARWQAAVVHGLGARWKAWRFAQGVLTFDDLLRLTRRLLAEHPSVEAELHGRFRMILVDEFQDTDPVQTEIILRLASGGGEDWQTAPIPPGRLFLVGDPKQAIYRFRGADVETYMRVRRRLEAEAGAAVLPITENFRSDPGVLAVVNAVVAEVLPPEPDPERPYMAPFAPLEAHRPPGGGGAWLVAAAVEGGSSAARREEARSAAALARRMVDERWPVSTGSGIRPMEYGDIALLMPGRTGWPLYQEAFRRAGVPLAAEGGNAFFSQEVVRGAALFLKAVWDPGDATSVVGWLRSPWVAVPDAELWRYHIKGGQFLPSGDVAGESLVGGWLEWVADLHRRCLWAHPLEWLDRLEAASPFTPLLLEDRQMWANYRKLRQWADRYTMRGRPASAFIAWLFEAVAESLNEPEAAVADDQFPNQVHFSTVHRAKGLEWPAVLLCNWHWKPRSDSAYAIREPAGTGVALQFPGRLVGAQYGTYRAAAMMRQEAETQRLLYVALTRARDYLLVVDAMPQDKMHERRIPEAAWPDPQKGWPVGLAKPAATPAQEAVRRPIWRPWEPSSGAHRKDVGTTEVQDPEAVAVGLEFHEAMERWFAHRPLSSAQAQHPWVVRAMAHPVLHRLAAGGTLGAGRTVVGCYPEYPVAGSGSGGDAVAGRVDLLVRLSHAVIVLDFKTGSETPEEQALHHGPQLSRYARCIQSALPDLPIYRWLYLAAWDLLMDVTHADPRPLATVADV